MTWLDAQPLKSVIYVSFGSITIMPKDELIEFWQEAIFMGHTDWLSAQKDGEGQVPMELVEQTKDRGYIGSWAPQEEVLAHKAIGGFFTHSG